jgi:hypothetical protein
MSEEAESGTLVTAVDAAHYCVIAFIYQTTVSLIHCAWLRT